MVIIQSTALGYLRRPHVHTADRLLPACSLLFIRLLLLLCLFDAVLLIFDLPPISWFGFVAVGSPYGTREGGTAGIQLVSLARFLGRLECLERDWLVAAESLAHINHAPATLAEALLQLLAFCR
jgi:hypothetical protein